tara:strand:- start:10632 stop:11087 length:456 start_codon:yes stop_codon:yes gene_type:complete
MKTEIKVHGLDELEKSLKQLETATTSKILRQSLFWAAKPMFEEMRDSAPNKNEDFLKKKNARFSIRDETKRWLSRQNKSDGNSAQVNIGYRMRGVWYAAKKGVWWIAEQEFGTKDAMPLSWMRRSAENRWQEVVDRFGQRIQYRIKKLEKK